MITFWFSLLSLLIPVLAGLYFLTKWYLTGLKHRYLLFFGLSLLFIQLFKIPNILINAGNSLAPSILNPFFFVSLALYFFSYYLLIVGLFDFVRHKIGKKLNLLSVLWFLALVLYYSVSFFVPKGYLDFPVWPGHVLFFIPAELATFWYFNKLIVPSKQKAILILSVYLFFVTSIGYIYVQTGPSSGFLWYTFVTLSWGISLLQILATALLSVGLWLLVNSKSSR